MANTPKIMVAVDPEALSALQAEMAALRSEIRSITMSPMTEWLPAGEYAKHAGVTRRTVMNWIASGQIESSRHGATVMVRVNRVA